MNRVTERSVGVITDDDTFEPKNEDGNELWGRPKGIFLPDDERLMEEGDWFQSFVPLGGED